MRAHQRMRDVGHALQLLLRHSGVGRAIEVGGGADRPLAVDAFLEIGGKPLIRRREIAHVGVAAFGRDGNAVQHRAEGRKLHVDLVDVPWRLGVAEHADRLAVLLLVGDEQHLAVARGRGVVADVNLQLAQARAEADHVFLLDPLAANQDDLVLEPCGADRFEHRIFERVGKIDAADLDANQRRQQMLGERHGRGPVHSGVMPASRMTLPHIADSVRMRSRNPSGVLVSTTNPCRSACSRSSG